MKLNCSTFPVSRLPFLCSTLYKRPICNSSSVKLKTPLFLKPSAFSVSLSDFQKWHHWAKNLVSSVGSSFVDLDNGPDSTLLCRELKWLIEDSVEDHSLIPKLGSENSDVNVKLRTSLDELYSLWKERIDERKPFQYIVGCEHWRDLVLSVQEGVLIPRPETESLVDFVENAVSSSDELRNGLWADLGTGSGAIAIGIAKVLGDQGRAIGIAKVLGDQGRVIATDLSPVAVAVATYNVERYGLQDMVEVRKGSWFEPLQDVEGKLTGLVSNPPYIPSDDISGLQAEVGRHEPWSALDGGTEGMDDLIHLCNGAASLLKPGGFFALETNGEKQCRYLVDHMEHDNLGCFFNVKIVSDFAGIQRFVTGFRK